MSAASSGSLRVIAVLIKVVEVVIESMTARTRRILRV